MVLALSGILATYGSSVFLASKKVLGLLEIWFLFGNSFSCSLDDKARSHITKQERAFIFCNNGLLLRLDSRLICSRLRLRTAEFLNYRNAEFRWLRLPRVSSIISKNKDTWYKASGYFRYRIKYSPESIQGAVV